MNYKIIFKHETIKYYREGLNFTQKECAEMLGVDYQQWQRWETGINSPTVNNLCKILVALHCNSLDMQYFFDTIIDETPKTIEQCKQMKIDNSILKYL